MDSTGLKLCGASVGAFRKWDTKRDRSDTCDFRLTTSAASFSFAARSACSIADPSRSSFTGVLKVFLAKPQEFRDFTLKDVYRGLVSPSAATADQVGESTRNTSLFRGLFLHYLDKAFAAGEVNFFSAYHHLYEPAAFRRHLAPAHNARWVVYTKRPFAGPTQVLDYVGRYTHRVAISNNRLVSMDDGTVSFRWKDYVRREGARGEA